MKSASEWSKAIGDYYVHGHGASESWAKISPEEVSKIQADALYYAAEFIGTMPEKYNRMGAWDGPYRAACVFGRSHLRDMAANLTRTEEK